MMSDVAASAPTAEALLARAAAVVASACDAAGVRARPAPWRCAAGGQVAVPLTRAVSDDDVEALNAALAAALAAHEPPGLAVRARAVRQRGGTMVHVDMHRAPVFAAALVGPEPKRSFFNNFLCLLLLLFFFFWIRASSQRRPPVCPQTL